MSEQMSKLGFFLSDCIPVRIRDFQAKLRESQRDQDGRTVCHSVVLRQYAVIIKYNNKLY